MTNIFSTMKGLSEASRWQDYANQLMGDMRIALNAPQVELYRVRRSPVTKKFIASLEAASGENDTARIKDEKLQGIMLSDRLNDLEAELQSRSMVQLDLMDKAHPLQDYLDHGTEHVELYPLRVNDELWGFLMVKDATTSQSMRTMILNNTKIWADHIALQLKHEAQNYLDGVRTTLNKIRVDHVSSPKSKIEQILALGCDIFNLDLGIVSNIIENDYILRYVYPASNDLPVGTTFVLGTTYCSITLRMGAVVGIPFMKESPYYRHPCYAAFNLESYFGVQLLVYGRYYGTLNFTSPSPHSGPFTDTDRKIIAEMGQLVGELIAEDSLS